MYSKQFKDCVIYVSFDNQKRATTVKWNGTKLFDQHRRIAAPFIKALLLSVDTEAKDKMAPLYYLVTHCQRISFIIATYYEISPAGGGCMRLGSDTGPLAAGRSDTPTFSCSLLSGKYFVIVLCLRSCHSFRLTTCVFLSENYIPFLLIIRKVLWEEIS